MNTLIRSLLILLLSTEVVAAANPDLPQRVGTFRQEMREFFTEAEGLPDNDVLTISMLHDGSVVAGLSQGFFVLRDGTWHPTREPADDGGSLSCPPELQQFVTSEESVLSMARHSTGATALGTELGLYLLDDTRARRVYPNQGDRRWAPTHVTVAFDSKGRLWFASRQGAGVLQDGTWTLYTGAEGLPYDDMTTVICDVDDTVWFGTTKGAIRFDGQHWSYRQGKRWLPDDEVRDIAVDDNGSAWIATASGVSHIYFQPMTLAQKAKYYEDEIDAHHRRTEYGYVIEAHTELPGKKDGMTLHDSDNDGLWTSMYGAGECFAYAATGDPAAKRRAQAAFRALRFLSEVPQGSKHAPPVGFIARTVREAFLGDPNTGAYTLSGQRRAQSDDGSWRVYEPRWPKSADEKYYWKSDTSSDELDGHYFFYPLYYDLVAENDAEKAVVREIVRANIDHLIDHDFSLYDHAGRTRWGVYGPRELNQNPEWFEERGLNSISILSYLNVAYHMTGDTKYREVAAELRNKHSYHINVMWPKFQRGLGSGNQSDDEMAFMSFYNLIRYEPDPHVRKLYTVAFANWWRLEEPEMNPLFNFCFAAVAQGVQFTNTQGTFDLSPWPTWIADSIDTLKQFPLDRFDWHHTNRHRKDIVWLSDHTADVFQGHVHGLGYRTNGKVIPVDERYFNHWNHNPWAVDSGGDGRTIGTGAVFTLPYYMGRYHGFIAPD